MRYKTLISKKLESLDNSLTVINSLVSRPDSTREQFDQWYVTIKEKVAEIQTLINTEQEG